MDKIRNENVRQAMEEYAHGIRCKNNGDLKEARNHFIKALRYLEAAYREVSGIERILVIKMFEKISAVLREIE